MLLRSAGEPRGGLRVRIAIVGASGQVGSDLRACAGGAGTEVLALNHADIEVTDGASVERALSTLEPGDVAVNTAAFHRTDDCEFEPERALRVNALGAYHVAAAARRRGAAIVYLSTDFVFDGAKPKAYVESDEPRPLNVYGVSKMAGEMLAAIANPSHYIARISSVFGVAGSGGKGGNFVETMIAKARRGEKIQVVDDVVMTPTYSADAARLLMELLSRRAPYGIYHLSNAGSCSWYQFTKSILELAGVEAAVEAITSAQRNAPAKRPPQSALASEKLAPLGLSARPWQAALEDYLRQKGHVRL